MSNFIPTPHISAKKEDFASTVLMPGDPLRSKLIAETFLENAKLINDVRGIHGYTGTYKGKRVSVMASGMGMASMGIYSYELFNFYEVENIIRIGSAGAISPDLKVKDIVIGDIALTESNFGDNFGMSKDYIPRASSKLVECAKKVATEKNQNFVVGTILSTDVFYGDADMDARRELGVLAVEMEAASLYMNAFKAGKNALAICTISDSLVTGESLSAKDRQESFTDMMELALTVAE